MSELISPSLRIVLCILVSYRLTDLIVLDDGPFDMFKKLRAEVGKLAAIHSSARGLAKFINCPFCVGVWMSAIVSLLWFFPTVYGDGFLIILGIAGGQAFLDSVGGRWNSQ